MENPYKQKISLFKDKAKTYFHSNKVEPIFSNRIGIINEQSSIYYLFDGKINKNVGAIYKDNLKTFHNLGIGLNLDESHHKKMDINNHSTILYIFQHRSKYFMYYSNTGLGIEHSQLLSSVNGSDIVAPLIFEMKGIALDEAAKRILDYIYELIIDVPKIMHLSKSISGSGLLNSINRICKHIPTDKMIELSNHVNRREDVYKLIYLIFIYEHDKLTECSFDYVFNGYENPDFNKLKDQKYHSVLSKTLFESYMDVDIGLFVLDSTPNEQNTIGNKINYINRELALYGNESLSLKFKLQTFKLVYNKYGLFNNTQLSGSCSFNCIYNLLINIALLKAEPDMFINYFLGIHFRFLYLYGLSNDLKYNSMTIEDYYDCEFCYNIVEKTFKDELCEFYESETSIFKPNERIIDKLRKIDINLNQHKIYEMEYSRNIYRKICDDSMNEKEKEQEITILKSLGDSDRKLYADFCDKLKDNKLKEIHILNIFIEKIRIGQGFNLDEFGVVYGISEFNYELNLCILYSLNILITGIKNKSKFKTKYSFKLLGYSVASRKEFGSESSYNIYKNPIYFMLLNRELSILSHNLSSVIENTKMLVNGKRGDFLVFDINTRNIEMDGLNLTKLPIDVTHNSYTFYGLFSIYYKAEFCILLNQNIEAARELKIKVKLIIENHIKNIINDNDKIKDYIKDLNTNYLSSENKTSFMTSILMYVLYDIILYNNEYNEYKASCFYYSLDINKYVYDGFLNLDTVDKFKDILSGGLFNYLDKDKKIQKFNFHKYKIIKKKNDFTTNKFYIILGSFGIHSSNIVICISPTEYVAILDDFCLIFTFNIQGILKNVQIKFLNGETYQVIIEFPYKFNHYISGMLPYILYKNNAGLLKLIVISNNYFMFPQYSSLSNYSVLIPYEIIKFEVSSCESLLTCEGFNSDSIKNNNCNYNIDRFKMVLPNLDNYALSLTRFEDLLASDIIDQMEIVKKGLLQNDINILQTIQTKIGQLIENMTGKIVFSDMPASEVKNIDPIFKFRYCIKINENWQHIVLEDHIKNWDGRDKDTYQDYYTRFIYVIIKTIQKCIEDYNNAKSCWDIQDCIYILYNIQTFIIPNFYKFKNFEILFMLQNTFLISKRQYDKYNEILNSAINYKDKKLGQDNLYSNIVHQFMLGEGKTSVITPLLFLAIKFLLYKIPIIITLEHLVDQTKQKLSYLSYILDFEVEIYSIFNYKKLWLEKQKDENEYFKDRYHIIDEFDSMFDYRTSMFNYITKSTNECIDEEQFTNIFRHISSIASSASVVSSASSASVVSSASSVGSVGSASSVSSAGSVGLVSSVSSAGLVSSVSSVSSDSLVSPVSSDNLSYLDSHSYLNDLQSITPPFNLVNDSLIESKSSSERPSLQRVFFVLEKSVQQCSNMRYNDDYGFLHNIVTDEIDKNTIRLVTPFLRRDTPLKKSNFSSILIPIYLTVKYYLENGFDINDAYNLFKHNYLIMNIASNISNLLLHIINY